MIRSECEQHHTPARDNQYRATARYYKDSCPYCEIDRLKTLIKEQAHTIERLVSEAANTPELLKQLAEARAEIERLNSVDHYACALCPDVAQARQEATMEILTEIEKYYVGGKHDYYHITTEDLIGMIKAKFRLEKEVLSGGT